MTRTLRRLTLIACLSCLATGFVTADEAGANKYLEQARKELADKDSSDKIETSLKLAEAELDGVDAAKKAPLTQAIAAVREQLKTGEMAAFKADRQRQLKRMFETAEAVLGVRQAGVAKQLDDLDAMLNDPKTKEALGAAEVDAQLKTLATFRKVSAEKMKENDLAAAARDVEYVEQQLPGWMKDLKEGAPNSQTSAATSMERRYAQFQTTIKDLPKDDPGVVALVGRMDKMKQQVDAAFGGVMVAEVLDRLKRNWEIGSDQFAGWEAETTPPKFADMVKNSNEANRRLGAPKTVEAALRARQFQESLASNEEAKASADKSPLKEFIESIAQLRLATEAKLASHADLILDDAQRTVLDEESAGRLESFVNDDLRLALEGHRDLAAKQARGQAMLATYRAAQGAAAKGRADELAKRRSEAAGKWPELIKNLDTVDDFDPAKAGDYKGKLIRIAGRRNRAGWDFGSEFGYDYAVDIDGKPVAGRFAPEVKAAVEEMKAATGADGLPEEDYDVIAVYDGTDGQIMRRMQVEGKVTVDNQDLRIRGEDKRSETAPVLRIVGLYCGPVAVYSKFSAEGSVGDTSGGLGWGARFLSLLIWGLAAFAVLLKAEFAPLAAAPALGPVRANLTSRNQIAVGLAFLALGLIYLIRGYVYYGFLGSIALVAAGTYLALDLFQSYGWWKPDYSDRLRMLAVPIGLLCAVVGLWRLLLGGVPAFI